MRDGNHKIWLEEIDGVLKMKANPELKEYGLNDVRQWPRELMNQVVEIDFSGCDKLENIESVSFHDMIGLKYVNLSNCKSLKKIDGGVFSDCNNLKTVDCSGDESLEVIGSGTFLCCESLENLVLKGCKNLKYISEAAFAGCDALKRLDISDCPNVEIEQYAMSKDVKLIKEKDDDVEVGAENRTGRPRRVVPSLRRVPHRDFGKGNK